MEKRLQLLLDDARYRRVEAEANRSGRSVASVIREAIDLRFGTGDAGRYEAGRRLLDRSVHADGEEPPWEEPPWEESKAAMSDHLAQRLDRL